MSASITLPARRADYIAQSVANFPSALQGFEVAHLCAPFEDAAHYRPIGDGCYVTRRAYDVDNTEA